MPIDWKSAETTHGLLVAVVAANDKLDLKRVAQILSLLRGEEVTYNAIENRMRVVKREATQLKERMENGETVGDGGKESEKSKKTAKGKDSVVSGRVVKSTKAKKGMAKKVKKSSGATDEAGDSGVGDEDEEGVVAKGEPEED